MDRNDLMGQTFLPVDFPLPLTVPFTYRTARREAGLDSSDLHWLVSEGFLRRPVKGVYVASQLEDSLELRCACLRLCVPADAVICDRHGRRQAKRRAPRHESMHPQAARLHGAEMVLAPNEHLHVAPVTVFLPAGRGRLRNGLVDSGERTFARDDIVEINGLRVTTPLRTAWDLGRQRWPERSLAAVDQMLRLGVFSKDELLAGVTRFRGSRWVRVLRAVAPLADGRAESPPESILRLRWIEAQLPTPTPQLEVWDEDEFLARLDLANDELRFAAEYDGVEWHSDPEQQENDRIRRKATEDRAGWVIQPFVKENLFGPSQNAERLLREGVSAARRKSVPGVRHGDQRSRVG